MPKAKSSTKTTTRETKQRPRTHRANVDFKARTEKQQELVDAIWKNDIVFSLGPAGTGKTLVLIAQALTALLSGAVERIIITRPVVEAGENLGFLPGDFEDKLAPYLVPLYDNIKKYISKDMLEDLIYDDKIEIAPFAYMRGRTFENCIVVADECQNASHEQIKMLLTRIGFNSKLLLNGDTSQIDLRDKNPKTCSLAAAANKLAHIKGVAVVEFSDADVQRHPLVREVIKAYEAEN